MENPFKKILHNQEVPKILKEKVLNDIDTIKLTLDIADLFVVKYPSVIEDMLGGEKNSNRTKD